MTNTSLPTACSVLSYTAKRIIITPKTRLYTPSLQYHYILDISILNHFSFPHSLTKVDEDVMDAVLRTKILTIVLKTGGYSSNCKGYEIHNYHPKWCYICSNYTSTTVSIQTKIQRRNSILK